MQKPRVLLVVSRPDGQGPVEGDQVQKKLESMHASKQIVLEGLIEPTHDSLLDSDYHPTSSWDAFRKAVGKDHPNIIHFIGHGRLSYDETHKHEMGELAFVGNDGKADWIDGGKFADNVVGSALRLVFLQACESALADPRANISGVAMRLATQNVPAIIAMQHKVRNVVANGFATGFYDKLASGVPIDVAVMEARDEVANMEGQSKSQQLAFATPVVYLSSYEGLIERAEGGGSSAGLGLPTELSQVVRAEPPPVALKPIVEKCPSCDSNFTEDERRTLFFCDCGLQLRCDGKKRDGSACAEPLRSLTTKRRYCNWCGSVISAREIRAEPDIGALSPASQSDPEKELRMRFPLPPSSAGR